MERLDMEARASRRRFCRAWHTEDNSEFVIRN